MWRLWIAMRVAVFISWPLFFSRIHSDTPYFAQELWALLRWHSESAGHTLCIQGPSGHQPVSFTHSCPLLQGAYLWEGPAAVVQSTRRVCRGLSVPADNLVMCRGRVIVPTLLFCKRKTLSFTFSDLSLVNSSSLPACVVCCVPAQWNRNLVFQS